MADAFSHIRNFREVSPSLATSGQPKDQDLASIARAGYEVVINLALHDDPRYSLADEAGTVRSLGMRYVHIPVQFNAPSKADLASFFDAMDQHRARKLWVHCAANMRVTAFLGLYRVLRQGWDYDRAFELMKSVWNPNDVWAAFISRCLADEQSMKEKGR